MYFDILKYLLEALAIAFVAKYVVGKKGDLKDILLLAATITVALIILDKFAPVVGMFTRQGAGFGTGFKLQGGGQEVKQIAGCGGCMISAIGGGRVEPMDDPVAMDYYGNNNVPTGTINPADEKHAIYDTLIATDNVQGGVQAGGGLQQALGTQRTLRGQSHAPQTGGGLQQALGTQRTLRGQSHAPQTGGVGGIGAMLETMDDPVARDYYTHNNMPNGGEGISVYNTVLATQETEPAKGSVQVNVLSRFIDDKMAMDCRNGQVKHEAFQDETAAERGLVYGTVPTLNHDAISPNTLYSGDLINIIAVTGDKLTLSEGNYIQATKPGDASPLNDRLFKLRIQKTKRQPPTKHVPIMYGSPVNIAFNNEQAQTVLLNHDGDLNVLKNTRDTVFELQSVNNTTGSVQKDTNVLICARTDSDKKCLKINPNDGHIILSSPQEATQFIITEQQGCGPAWRYIK